MYKTMFIIALVFVSTNLFAQYTHKPYTDSEKRAEIIFEDKEPSEVIQDIEEPKQEIPLDEVQEIKPEVVKKNEPIEPIKKVKIPKREISSKSDLPEGWEEKVVVPKSAVPLEQVTEKIKPKPQLKPATPKHVVSHKSDLPEGWEEGVVVPKDAVPLEQVTKKIKPKGEQLDLPQKQSKTTQQPIYKPKPQPKPIEPIKVKSPKPLPTNISTPPADEAKVEKKKKPEQVIPKQVITPKSDLPEGWEEKSVDVPKGSKTIEELKPGQTTLKKSFEEKKVVDEKQKKIEKKENKKETKEKVEEEYIRENNKIHHRWE